MIIDMEKKILDLFKLNSQVALIIGGNRGLGLSMGKALAEAGASISIAARDKIINEQAAKELRDEYKVDVITTYCDVTDEPSVKEAVQQNSRSFWEN